jgi:hypothetical protein
LTLKTPKPRPGNLAGFFYGCRRIHGVQCFKLEIMELEIYSVATKHDLAEMKFELLKWIGGLALAQFSVLIAILLKVFG